jgi:phenylacetate-coenzyme A ligase PaaK-like adenylate-forming protein
MNLLRLFSFSGRSLLAQRVRRMAPEKVAALQRRRVRRLVRLAVERSEFYRERYRGIDPRHFELADLPPTNKAELMANFGRVVTDPAVRRADVERFVDDPERNVGRLFLGRYVVSHSSGTQGQPILVVQETRQLEILFGLQLTRGNVERPGVGEAVRRLFHPARLAVVTMKRGFYPTAALFEHLPEPARAYVRLLRLAQTDADVVERLNAFAPTVLAGYAGHLDRLAGEALAGRLRLAPGLRQVVSNSEPLTDAARERIVAGFGVPVLDNYASCECPFLSNGCPADRGAHVNADWALLEVVDESYRPVPPGTAGQKVLVTNLANTVQPILRYEINDVVTMAASACRCGSLLPRIERIEGRQTDAFQVGEGGSYRAVPPKVFKHALDHVREVREWQAVQTGRNEVALRLELLPGAALDEAHLRQCLDRQLRLCGLGGVLAVTHEVVPSLEPDPATGKFRRSVSLVGPPAERSAERPEPALV